MNYFKVEVESYRLGEWFAFIEETCYTLTATSRVNLEAAVREHLEEALGEKYYEVIWLG